MKKERKELKVFDYNRVTVNPILIGVSSIAISNVLGAILTTWPGPLQMLLIQWLVGFGILIGVVLSTSLLGKIPQLVGLSILVLSQGLRYPVLGLILSGQSGGRMPDIAPCMGILALWIGWLIYRGHKIPFQSDEWFIAITSITQLVVGMGLMVIISKI